MATDVFLLDRIRSTLRSKQVIWIEKRMFGGHCFMVDGKMLMGTFLDGLMVRIHPDKKESLKKRNGVGPMMMKNREMKGYLLVDGEGFDQDEDLEFWINECLEFNPLAKSSKKKK